MTNCQKWRIATIITSAVAVCYAGYVHMEVRKVNKTVKTSIDSIPKSITIEASDKTIHQAVNKAFEQSIDKIVRLVSNEMFSSSGTCKDVKGK